MSMYDEEPVVLSPAVQAMNASLATRGQEAQKRRAAIDIELQKKREASLNKELTSPSAARRKAAQAQLGAMQSKEVVPVATGAAPPTAISQDWEPSYAQLSDFVQPRSPESVISRATRETDADVASSKAADRAQYEGLRRQLGTLDLSDLDAERKQAYEYAASRGRLPKSGVTDAINKEERARRATAQTALQAIDTDTAAMRRADKEDRAVAIQAALAEDSNVPDSMKQQIKILDGIASNISAATEDRVAAQRGLDSMMLQLTEMEIAREMARSNELEGPTQTYPSGNYIQARADGGEMLPPEETVPPALPAAIGTEPLPLDSGDYIIPVEAMRFYGRKFFQDLINKAEDVE